MLIAQYVSLYQNITAFGFGQMVSRFDFSLRSQFERNTSGVIAVNGFDADRQTYVLGRFPSFLG
jgi:hypothetical protein